MLYIIYVKLKLHMNTNVSDILKMNKYRQKISNFLKFYQGLLKFKLSRVVSDL